MSDENQSSTDCLCRTSHIAHEWKHCRLNSWLICDNISALHLSCVSSALHASAGALIFWSAAEPSHFWTQLAEQMNILKLDETAQKWPWNSNGKNACAFSAFFYSTECDPHPGDTCYTVNQRFRQQKNCSSSYGRRIKGAIPNSYFFDVRYVLFVEE